MQFLRKLPIGFKNWSSWVNVCNFAGKIWANCSFLNFKTESVTVKTLICGLLFSLAENIAHRRNPNTTSCASAADGLQSLSISGQTKKKHLTSFASLCHTRVSRHPVNSEQRLLVVAAGYSVRLNCCLPPLLSLLSMCLSLRLLSCIQQWEAQRCPLLTKLSVLLWWAGRRTPLSSTVDLHYQAIMK